MKTIPSNQANMKYNDDPVLIAKWLLSHKDEFPFEEDELEVIERVADKEYFFQPVSIYCRYEIVILYWQMVGFLRKRKE